MPPQQRDALQRPERRIAEAQAEQQRQEEERARREQILAQHRRDAEQREEERRALIIRQHEAELQAQRPQPPESAAAPPQSVPPGPAVPAAENPVPHPIPDRVFHIIGIALFVCAIILSIGGLIRDRLHAR